MKPTRPISSRQALAFSALLLAVAVAPSTRATTLVRRPTVELAAHADAILVGRVLSTAARWEGTRIVTDVTFALDADGAVRGPATPTLRFSVAGGSIDDLSMRVVGGASFAGGDRAVVLLARDASGGLRQLGLADGKLAVHDDRPLPLVVMRLRADGPLEPMPLAVGVELLRASRPGARR